MYSSGSKPERLFRNISRFTSSFMQLTLSLPTRDTTTNAQPASPLPAPNAITTVQLQTKCLQNMNPQWRAAPTHLQVTTLPDFSSSVPTFAGGCNTSASQWNDRLERSQCLISWSPATIRSLVVGKLKATASDWHSVGE